jgi:hypothetical protein
VPPDSEVAQVLNEVGGGQRVEPGDARSLAALLLTWLRGEAAVAPATGVQRYTRDATTQRLALVLDAAADRRVLEPLT